MHTHSPKPRLAFYLHRVSTLAAILWMLGFAVYEHGHAQPAAIEDAAVLYRTQYLPMLERYCFECHSGSESEGGVSLDARSESELLKDKKLWLQVLRNVRADMMPPRDSDQPTAADKKKLAEWIASYVFEVDTADPFPGNAPLRRLNRNEYRNTIRELLGVDFNAEIVFPPDDTGFGFDNISEAMSLSPMLLEKYLEAAKTIADEAVPTMTWVTPVQRWSGRDFVSEDKRINGSMIQHDRPAIVQKTFEISYPGEYKIAVREKSHGSFEFHPGRYHIVCTLDGKELYNGDYRWEEGRESRFETTLPMDVGTHAMTFELSSLPQADHDEGDLNGRFVRYELASVAFTGPLDDSRKEHPRGYERIFTREVPPEDAQERQRYAEEILSKFAARANRRPVSQFTTDRLVAIAKSVYEQPDKTFEAGIQKAVMALIASPQFLFRMEDVETLDETSAYPKIDEYALASRLSYLFWSSMPDDTLSELAGNGSLRDNLPQQVQRMIRDPRADEFIRSFAGQWLRARDVEQVSIDPIAATGFQKEFEAARTKMMGRFRRPKPGDPPPDPETEKAFARFRELIQIRDRFDAATRTAMRRETEMAFEYVVREDRSLLELIDADYVFANDKLAALYQLEGVQGPELRRVSLPAGSPRGGVLTQGTMLAVTSNPTRTSPVKRGLFILDNILGTPAPPAPPNVPALEDSADRFGDRTPSLRELLAVHREAALCSSCHSRMDPLGLALENFNAFGAWRERDGEQPIDSVGELITGEKFTDIRELKKILVDTRRKDYYRCVTEKLLVYALGRGLETYDEVTVDKIVERLEQGGGRFSILLEGILHSAPFQRKVSTNSQLVNHP